MRVRDGWTASPAVMRALLVSVPPIIRSSSASSVASSIESGWVSVRVAVDHQGDAAGDSQRDRAAAVDRAEVVDAARQVERGVAAVAGQAIR